MLHNLSLNSQYFSFHSTLIIIFHFLPGHVSNNNIEPLDMSFGTMTFVQGEALYSLR